LARPPRLEQSHRARRAGAPARCGAGRGRSLRVSRFVEPVADTFFLLGLMGITGVAFLFADEVI
jgi:hypothetical protein